MTDQGKLRLLTASMLRTRLAVGGLLHRLLPATAIDRLQLIESARGPDAGLRYLAYALPEREAVWWCCMCVRHAAGIGMQGADAKALHGTEQWVRQPGQTTRQTLLALSREADPSGPAAFAARAAFASRVEQREHTKAGFSAAQSVARAADLLVNRTEGLARFRLSALDIAAGGAGWIDPEPNSNQLRSR